MKLQIERKLIRYKKLIKKKEAEAYQRGFKTGQEHGKEEGFEAGYEEGWKEGTHD